jgi:hypothetical protein
MKQKIMRGVWSAGVLAGLAAGVLAAVSTPTAAFGQPEKPENTCYRCDCHDVLGCVCSLIACPEGEP